MEITQEDLLLVLKSVKEELVNEEKEAEKLKAAAEASESSASETTEDSSPVAKKAAAECSESESESESSESSAPEKKKSAEVEQEQPADLYETYVGLGKESPDELKNHFIAAAMASMAQVGHDMGTAWTSFKSAQEEVKLKSAEQPDAIAKEVAEAKAVAAQAQEQNKALVEKNTVLEKSLKDTDAKIAELTVKFAQLASKPEQAQAASVKVTDPSAQVIVKAPQEIVKSLADAAKSDTLDDKDREIITRYTLRSKMTAELQEFFKKIGSK